jgi:hypothetical protein
MATFDLALSRLKNGQERGTGSVEQGRERINHTLLFCSVNQIGRTPDGSTDATLIATHTCGNCLPRRQILPGAHFCVGW